LRMARSFDSRQKARVSQQGVAAAIVENLAGLEEFIPDQQVRKCGDVFGTCDPTERSKIDEALLERVGILSKVAYSLARQCGGNQRRDDAVDAQSLVAILERRSLHDPVAGALGGGVAYDSRQRVISGER